MVPKISHPPVINFMKVCKPASVVFPIRIASPSGISFECNANGSIRRMDHGDIMVNLSLGNEVEGGLANVHLRLLGDAVTTIPLLGPGSPASYQTDERGLFACGTWGDLEFRLRLVLAEMAAAWFWHVELENTGATPITCDLIHTQDIALAHYGLIRLNEFYISHYVDHALLRHPQRGCVLASRQNLSMGGGCPWRMIGSLGRGVAYATDALQFYGLRTRVGEMPKALMAGLPNRRLQHEHSLVCIQDEPMVIASGAKVQRGFFGWFEPDRQTATVPEDVEQVAAVLALPEATPPRWPAATEVTSPAKSLFCSAPLLATLPLDERGVTACFGSILRHAEQEAGELLSFFTGDGSHVVLRAKELRVLRPHGHILRSGGLLIPDESALTSTVWMNGVFHSMVTQGHVSINRFLSTCHTYLGLFRSHGQRIFVELGGCWHLLGVPSAFAMAPDCCRWIYQHAGGLIEVRSTAPDDRHELRLQVSVLAGPPVRFLISHHVALNGDDGSQSIPVVWERSGNGVFVRAIPDSDVGRRFPTGGFRLTPTAGTVWEKVGGDELLFGDGGSRQQPFLCVVTAAALTVGLTIEGCLVAAGSEEPKGFWNSLGAGLQINAPASSPLQAAASGLGQILPWFMQNALVHYLSPRGLEQYSGGGWGTRDVCQGPVELLLALGRCEPMRDLLGRVLRQQNVDGDWPQWFMFFDRERGIRPDDSHGDIVYWPVLALAQYLCATGDAAWLDEVLPYFHPEGDALAEQATVWQHVERALDLIQRRVIAGTYLASYGHGDWNDSLQPVKPDMRDNLCSSWTVTLNYQTFRTLAEAMRVVGQDARAAALETKAACILEEFQRRLIVDDVITGLAYFHTGGATDFMLHPRDRTTGLSYSLLPMIHAIINDMFTPTQAEHHLGLIRQHLLGPDGARLFDQPLAYHGGPQTYFQRAESASYFGREIGLMYTHAHLRYCEALARYGSAEDFFHALCQINPIGLREIVPTAALRQANCYYSSSDAAFADRYEAFVDYGQVKSGEIPLEGGWRVYSSGAGISVRLIMQCFLGLRQEKSALVVDPVIPPTLDGLKAELNLAGGLIVVHYRMQANGCGPVSVQLNGAALPFTREPNPYRSGGVRISWEAIASQRTGTNDQLLIWLA